MTATRMKNDTIESVLNGRAKEGWMIFRYRLLRGLFKLGMRILFLGLFGAGLGILALYRDRLPKDPGTVIVLALLAVAALAVLVMVVRQLKVLAHARSNMIVVTENGVVRSLGGRVQEWPFSQIAGAQMVHYQGAYHFPPDHALELTEAEGGRIVELARHSVFQGMGELFHALQRR